MTIKRLRRRRRIVTGVGKDRHGSPSWEYARVSSLVLCHQGIRNILDHLRVYDILDKRHERSCRTCIGVAARLVDYAAHQCGQRRGVLQLVPNPLNRAIWRAAGIWRIRIRLDNEVEIARSSVARGRGRAVSPATDIDLTGGGGIAWAPCKRGAGGIQRKPACKEGRRRISSVIYVAHDLVQAEPGFLEGGQYLGFGLVVFLRSPEQSERSSGDHKKYTQSDEQFDECEPDLALYAGRGIHFP